MDEVIEILDVFLRGIFSLVVLFLFTKLMGRKQISQLTLFDYIIGISIGSLASEMVLNRDAEYLHGLVAMAVYAGAATMISVLSLKSIKARRLFTGAPLILLQHGKIIEKNLKRAKYDLNELLSECRVNGYFNLSELEYIIIEPNGKLSLMPTAENQPIVAQDMKLPLSQVGLTANLIIDGNIMYHNLAHVSKEETWLRKQLKEQKIALKDIFLATYDVERNLSVYRKNETVTPNNVFD